MDKATLFQEITMYWMSQRMKMLQFVFCIAAVLDYWLYRKRQQAKKSLLSYRFDVN